MKRLFDFLFSLVGLLFIAPLLLPVIVLIWLQDFHTPFYIAPRVGRNGRQFNMVKLRSMVINADKTGVDSTSASDSRITTVGRFVRRFKLDELMQLWNVILGDMSLVGPRPNVKSETDLYTLHEKKLLTVRPGITDFSSIVFSDEGDILENMEDPDIAYNQLIRPWKSRLGLFYIENQSIILDFKLILITIIAIVSRKRALQLIVSELTKKEASDEIIAVSMRNSELIAYPPPGADTIVTSR